MGKTVPWVSILLTRIFKRRSVSIKFIVPSVGVIEN